MSGHNASTRAHELRRILEEASDLYYNEGAPPMSDAAYDALFAELRALEDAHPDLLTPDSPTQRVGAPLPRGSRFETVAHLVPMLSIESLTSTSEVRDFAVRAIRHLGLDEGTELPWAAEPKLDGVSASLLYEEGVLVRGLSRGDGAQGEDITQNLRAIRSVPLRLSGSPASWPRRIEVRGEVILSASNFARLREESETTTDTPFRNARNTVAGTLKLLDPATVSRRRLDFVCWGVGHAEGLETHSYAELRKKLEDFGFTLSQPFASCTGIEEVVAYHDRLEADRDQLPYEMDGIVAKVDDTELQRRLGRTARTPRWCLAFKFAPRRGTSRIERIVAQVGRTGAVTPVAELEPVELAGVTVRRATLHNWGLLAERDIRVDDIVEVERAGDVIPAVVEVHATRRGPDSMPTTPPTQCPTCSSQLEAEGAFLYCVNVECPDQLRGRVIHLASRRALDIEGLGPKAVDQLMDAGLVASLEDVFRLPQRRDELAELERWGERSVDKLCAAIDGARSPDLARFLNALGIRHVGEQTAKDLASAFEDLDALRGADEEALCEVEGIGEEVAKSIRRFFEQPGNLQFLDGLREAGVAPRRATRTEGPLSGRVFCFTGGLSTMSRDEAKLLVEQMGAKTSASITKTVTDVVAGAKAGSKLDRARKLEIAILDEDGFRALVGAL
ncbi:MAG: NAD-dependent DNA ligase LigA [Planctomycetota bacterium]